MSSYELEETVLLSTSEQDINLHRLSGYPTPSQQCRLMNQPSTNLKRMLQLMLAFLLGTTISAVVTFHFAQRKLYVNLDRHCTTHMSMYCKSYHVQKPSDQPTYPRMLPRGFIYCEINIDADSRLHKAPVLEEVDVRYSTTTFNGSFLQETVYRRSGSPEVDLAWEALGIGCTSHRCELLFPNEHGQKVSSSFGLPILLTTQSRPSFCHPRRGGACERTYKATCATSEEVWRRLLCKCGGATPPTLPGTLH